MAVFFNMSKENLSKLKGWERENPKTRYESVRLVKGEVTLVLYTSGKLLLQGKPTAVEKAVHELERAGMGKPEKQESFRRETGWVIGSDESLKGDTFGGLVVAAVKADDAIRNELLALGVADSKTLSDTEVLSLAESIKKIARCEIRSLLPEEYNAHDGKVTQLLNKLHKGVAQDLGTGKQVRHIVDKYPGCAVGDVQEEKAESKYVEVAAASVLARAAALQQLNYLSAQAGFEVPKGSTHVKSALMELKERKLEFRKFVKVGFRNVREFLE